MGWWQGGWPAVSAWLPSEHQIITPSTQTVSFIWSFKDRLTVKLSTAPSLMCTGRKSKHPGLPQWLCPLRSQGHSLWSPLSLKHILSVDFEAIAVSGLVPWFSSFSLIFDVPQDSYFESVCWQVGSLVSVKYNSSRSTSILFLSTSSHMQLSILSLSHVSQWQPCLPIKNLKQRMIFDFFLHCVCIQCTGKLYGFFFNVYTKLPWSK